MANADLALEALPSGQIRSKQLSMEEYSAEQRHEMSPKLSQEDFFSTWATQANKHAGGVARACGRAIASASNEETFKPYMMQML